MGGDQVGTDDVAPTRTDSTVGPTHGVQVAAIDGGLVVLHPGTGRRALLNPTAALIFTAFPTGRPVHEAIDQLATETGIDGTAITADVLATIDRLVGRGLLTRDDLAGNPPEPVGATVCTAVAPPDGDIRDVAGVPIAFVDVGTHGPVPAALEPFALLGRAGPDRPVATVTVGPDATPTAVFDDVDRILATNAPGLRFHAGAVERDGRVVVIAGPSGAGKSTLTARLVQAGWRYVTDEIVVVDPSDLGVVPYPRPIGLDRIAFAHLGVDPGTATRGRKYALDAERLGTTSAGGVVALLVLRTGRLAAAPTEVPPAEALMTLLGSTFAGTFADPDALEHLAGLCASTPAVRLGHMPMRELVEAIGARVAGD